jgi:hypothetical protein
MATDSEEHDHHGNSPAAWTAVTIILVAFAIGTVAFFLEIEPVVWIAVALVAIGVIVGVVMAKVGYGVTGPRYVSRDSVD